MAEKVPYSVPRFILSDNTHEVEEATWNRWSIEARRTFNYVYEICQRNETTVFALDLFPLGHIHTNDKIKLHKILAAGAFNLAYEAANYVTGDFPVDGESLRSF